MSSAAVHSHLGKCSCDVKRSWQVAQLLQDQNVQVTKTSIPATNRYFLVNVFAQLLLRRNKEKNTLLVQLAKILS